ncbi:MAG: CRISPR-associated protein Cas4 [Nitrososphaeria archaeon]
MRASTSAGSFSPSDLYQFYYCRRKPVLERVYGVKRAMKDKMLLGKQEHEAERRRLMERAELYGIRREDVEWVREGECMSYGRLSGCPDLLLRMKDGSLFVVELKLTDYPVDTYARRIQIYAYAYLVKKALGAERVSALLYYVSQRRAVRVPLPDNLEEAVESALDELERALASERLPPAVRSSRCGYCEYSWFCWGP